MCFEALVLMDMAMAALLAYKSTAVYIEGNLQAVQDVLEYRGKQTSGNLTVRTKASHVLGFPTDRDFLVA